jgi:molybdate transport system substrate-binding protein
MNKTHLYLSIFLCSLLLAACTPSPRRLPSALNVFAAASLTGLSQGWAAARPNPGLHVQFNFAGSQALAQQLAQGAPADIFASANWVQMRAVVQAGRTRYAAVETFAQNRLVIVIPGNNLADLQSLADLARPGLRLVLAAPEVPAGQYTNQMLDLADQDPAYGADFKAGVTANVVSYEDSVKAVLTKVRLGEADAGIVYASDLGTLLPGDFLEIASPPEVLQIAIPEALNITASYPIAVLDDAAYPELAAEFMAYVLSPDGQALLAQYGFLPAQP